MGNGVRLSRAGVSRRRAADHAGFLPNKSACRHVIGTSRGATLRLDADRTLGLAFSRLTLGVGPSRGCRECSGAHSATSRAFTSSALVGDCVSGNLAHNCQLGATLSTSKMLGFGNASSFVRLATDTHCDGTRSRRFSQCALGINDSSGTSRCSSHCFGGRPSRGLSCGTKIRCVAQVDRRLGLALKCSCRRSSGMHRSSLCLLSGLCGTASDTTLSLNRLPSVRRCRDALSPQGDCADRLIDGDRVVAPVLRCFGGGRQNG